MLALSRKPGESIHIGNVVVTIVSVSGGRVRVAVDAGPEVKILRGELVEVDPVPAGTVGGISEGWLNDLSLGQVAFMGLPAELGAT